MPPFFTKKQKKQMRERRKRKRQAQHHGKNAETKENGVKRQEAPPQEGPIVIPSHLSGKEARKFRKETRRKARAGGRDDSKLVFVTKEELQQRQNDTSQQPPHKKRKRTFPSINELLEKQKREAVEREKQAALEKQHQNLSTHRYVAMDCEMVGIGSGGKQSALARVSLTDWSGEVLLDTFVQVPSRVTDFRTHVSGVTSKDISSRKNAMEVTKCRSLVSELLKDKILVGHALKNDLHALLLEHPKHDIRDTAKYRPFQRCHNQKWRPRKLKHLVKDFVGTDIQIEGEAHDSVEDARATMTLFQQVCIQWEKEAAGKANKKRKK